MFLCIQNPGVSPIEGFTLLGVSTTRDCGVEGTIGQFGSGNKHAINVLLRAGVKVFVYCGKTRLDFHIRDDEIDDGLTRKAVKRVMCKLGGTSTRTIDLGWVLDFGALDWTEIAMALREFISNAIDRTVREENGEFFSAIQDGRLAVAVVEDSRVKARDGYTRVYVETNAAVEQFLHELPKRFLHFSGRPEQVKQSLLPKADRNLNGKKTAVIYRGGVYVREIEESDRESVYDYNFRLDELKIDECRNSNEYYVRAATARLYRRATATELYPVFQALAAQRQVFEGQLDVDYIMSSWEKPKDEQKSHWQRAWKAVAGDAVLCSPSDTLTDFVKRKGYDVKSISSASFAEAAAHFGVLTDATVLTSNEQKGREKVAATDAAREAVDVVWRWIEAVGLTNGKEKPLVGCYQDVMNAGSRELGFADETGVYLALDHAGSINKMVLKMALEECAHWVTGATDNSRDFQDFLLRVIVEANTVRVAAW